MISHNLSVQWTARVESFCRMLKNKNFFSQIRSVEALVAPDFIVKSEDIKRYDLNLFGKNASIGKIRKCRFVRYLFYHHFPEKAALPNPVSGISLESIIGTK